MLFDDKSRKIKMNECGKAWEIWTQIPTLQHPKGNLERKHLYQKRNNNRTHYNSQRAPPFQKSKRQRRNIIGRSPSLPPRKASPKDHQPPNCRLPNCRLPDCPTAQLPNCQLPTTRLPTARLPTAHCRLKDYRLPDYKTADCQLPTQRLPTADSKTTDCQLKNAPPSTESPPPPAQSTAACIGFRSLF
jgi:hypothetical protein